MFGGDKVGRCVCNMVLDVNLVTFVVWVSLERGKVVALFRVN